MYFEKKTKLAIGLQTRISDWRDRWNWYLVRKYNIKMIVDDTIATIYVDGVALNARAYKRPGESLSLFASEGSLKVTNCKVTTGLKKQRQTAI